MAQGDKIEFENWKDISFHDFCQRICPEVASNPKYHVCNDSLRKVMVDSLRNLLDTCEEQYQDTGECSSLFTDGLTKSAEIAFNPDKYILVSYLGNSEGIFNFIPKSKD